MSGHFFAFKNREKISEAKKASLRASISHKKTNLINNTESNSNVEEVQISSNELNEIKKQIRLKIKIRENKQNLMFAFSFFALLLILILLSIKFNVF